jgi:hypothetical protein
MLAPVNFGIEFRMSLLVFGLLAKWYAWPYLRSRSFTRALLILLAPFRVCYLGLMSLVPGIVDPAVTHSSFRAVSSLGRLHRISPGSCGLCPGQEKPEANPRRSVGV